MSSSVWETTRSQKWVATEAGMEAMLAPLDEPLINALRIDGVSRVADIGCGCGGTSVKLHRVLPSGSFVEGFDISTTLLEFARQRVKSDQVAFSCMDVAKSRVPQQFDRVVSRFGVMFFEEPLSAFKNVRQFLVPGGRFAFAVWGRREENPWMGLVRRVVARWVNFPPADQNAPGPFRYAEAEGFRELLTVAGFEEVAVQEWRGELPIGGCPLSAADAAFFALSSFSTFAELLAEADSSAFDAALQSLTEEFLPYHRDDAVWLGAQVNIVTGIRPQQDEAEVNDEHRSEGASK